MKIFFLNWVLWFIPVLGDAFAMDVGQAHGMKVAWYGAMVMTFVIAVPGIVAYYTSEIVWWHAILFAVTTYLSLGAVYLFSEWNDRYRPSRR